MHITVYIHIYYTLERKPSCYIVYTQNEIKAIAIILPKFVVFVYLLSSRQGFIQTCTFTKLQPCVMYIKLAPEILHATFLYETRGIRENHEIPSFSNSELTLFFILSLLRFGSDVILVFVRAVTGTIIMVCPFTRITPQFIVTRVGW